MAGNGDVPKWLKGADSKSARRRKACGGSNPSISAIEKLCIQSVLSFQKIPVLPMQSRDFLLFPCKNICERGVGDRQKTIAPRIKPTKIDTAANRRYSTGSRRY